MYKKDNHRVTRRALKGRSAFWTGRTGFQGIGKIELLGGRESTGLAAEAEGIKQAGGDTNLFETKEENFQRRRIFPKKGEGPVRNLYEEDLEDLLNTCLRNSFIRSRNLLPQIRELRISRGLTPGV